ncbi:MAG: hypothetical protein ACE5QF_06005 [Thermoplasmata archaeon]
MPRQSWADRRLTRHLKVYWLAIALLSSYLLLPPNDTVEVAENIEFSNPNIPVDVTPASSTFPKLEADANGSLHAVWVDSRFGDGNIAYTRSTDGGKTWSSVTNVSRAFVGYRYHHPDIAVDVGNGPYAGSIYVIFQRTVTGGETDIIMSISRDGGDTWMEGIRVDHGAPGVVSGMPRVSVGSDGVVYAVWHDSRIPGSQFHIFAAKSVDGGMAWLGDYQISTSHLVNAYPALASSRGGDIYVAWQEYGENHTTSILVGRSTDGSSWNITEVAAGGNYSTSRRTPDVAVNDSGSILVSWMFCDTSGNDFVQFSRSDDGAKTWMSPVQVSHGPPDVSSMFGPRLATDHGTIYATWSDDRNGDHDIWLAQSVDGGRHWGDGNIKPNDVRVDDTDNNGNGADDDSPQERPDIIVSDFFIAVIWADYRSSSNYDVYFASYEVASLQITEISDSPDGNEWIEIHNFGGKPLNAAAYSLAVAGGSLIDLDPLGMIGQQEYRIIGDVPGADLLVDLDLPDEGPDTRLKKWGQTEEQFAFGQRGPNPDPLEGESVARYWSGERYTQDWTREEVPTPGLVNVVPPVQHNPEVVLNEILFNPSSPSDAFVEVYYPGWKSVSLMGFKLVCDSDFALDAIELNSSNREAVLRFSSDPAFFSSMNASGDNVYLYDPNGRLMDMVGWSSPHTQGLSMSRVPDGFGTHDGYNDITSEVAGWAFDTTPTLWSVRIGPDQAKNGEASEQVKYELIVTNKDLSSHYFNINYSTGPGGWKVDLYQSDGLTALSDSAGDPDLIPDIGSLGPEQSRKIVVGVTLPSTLPVGAVERTRVFATASDDSTITDFATLSTRPYPDVMIDKTADPSTIFVEGAGPEFQTESTITLSISGIGSSIEWNAPQDVIFLIDQSWSIGDAFGLERQVALNYLDNLKKPDTAAVIYFEWDPQPKRPLTTNYEQVRLDIYSEARASDWKEVIPPCDPPDDNWPDRPCYTRPGEAIVGALRELEMNGNESHLPIILMLTDGWHNDWYSMPEWILDPRIAATYAKENGTRIYTLGITGRDENSTPCINDGILKEIASISGGEYKKIDAQHDFDGMYENISTFVDDTAARDPDPYDSIPMIEDLLPPYVHYVHGSFVDPSSGQPRPPDELTEGPAGSMFKWFPRVLRVGETWSVSFNVTVAMTGLVSADIYPDSRVSYATWNWTNLSVPFPDVKIRVLPSIHPPTNVSASLIGANRENVRIQWTLSLDDPATVDRYEIYYGTTFHPSGNGYSLLGWAPKGFDSAVHVGGGEGDANDYFYMICAVASSGGSVCSPDQAGKFTRPLAKGPNLVSIPLIQSNESIEHVLQTVNYDKAWTYDSLSKQWKWYMKYKEYRRGLYSIDHSIGLWINVTENSNLTVAGVVPAQTTIQLYEGWNLIPFPSFNSSYAVADMKVEIGATRVEGFSPSAPPHFLRVLSDSETLLAGYGYWVRVPSAIVWAVDIP